MVIDIETTSTQNCEEYAEEFIAPANYKDAEKIKEYVIEKQNAWLKKAALSPLTGRVCAVGFCWKYKDTEDPIIDMVLDATGEHEYNLLTRFWKEYMTLNGKVVGHNIRMFDLPFLYLRSLKYGISPPISPPFDGIADTMELWNAKRYPKDFISLLNLAKFFDIPTGVKETMSGADFGEHLKTRESIELAKEYLKNDLIITQKIFSKFNI